MPWSSNATFLVKVLAGDHTCAQAIHNPILGERPLWEFPSGLHPRYVAVYGLCFAADFKLRTVIWGFSGERVPKELLDAIARVARAVPLDVAALLDDEENEAIRARASALLARGVFPKDASGHRYPWPMV